MCQKNKEGQPQGCPKVAAPPADEIRRILRGLTPAQRLRALEMIRRIKPNGKEGAR